MGWREVGEGENNDKANGRKCKQVMSMGKGEYIW